MITLPAEIEGLATRKDRTVKITIGTSELSPAKSGEIFSLQNKVVVLAIKTTDFNDEEKEFIEVASQSVDQPTKSQSQRLRGVFYKLWEQDKKGFDLFDGYYAYMMEAVIKHYKDKIL